MFPYNILLNIKSGITPVKSRDSATLFLFNCRRWDYNRTGVNWQEKAAEAQIASAAFIAVHSVFSDIANFPDCLRQWTFDLYISKKYHFCRFTFPEDVSASASVLFSDSALFSDGASTLARNKNYYKPQKCGLFYVKFYLFLCCTELYFIFICDIMRYETQL